MLYSCMLSCNIDVNSDDKNNHAYFFMPTAEPTGYIYLADIATGYWSHGY